MNAATTLKPGHDGHLPEFMPARDVTARDPVTGKLSRKTPDGPQNVNTDRIEYLFAHGGILKRQYDAANKLMEDEYLSSCEASPTTSGFERVDGGGGFSFVDLQVGAARRLKAAKLAFYGWRANHWPIVVAVALRNLSIDAAADLFDIDKRAVKAMLRVGLHLLADHYRLEDIA